VIQLFRLDATSRNTDQTDAFDRMVSRKALDDLLIFKNLVRDSHPDTKASRLVSPTNFRRTADSLSNSSMQSFLLEASQERKTWEPTS